VDSYGVFYSCILFTTGFAGPDFARGLNRVQSGLTCRMSSILVISTVQERSKSEFGTIGTHQIRIWCYVVKFRYAGMSLTDCLQDFANGIITGVRYYHSKLTHGRYVSRDLGMAGSDREQE
jgi:hypothetical protein